MLVLDQVVKHYRSVGDEVCAVDGVTLSISRGEMVALHGPSGSGKTTLLLLIAALLRPEQGTIRCDGRDITSMSDDEASDYLLRDVGFIYQNFRLLPGVTAIENAALKLILGGVNIRRARTLATPWLEQVGLGDHVYRTPDRLSGGERQRVAIARALANEPKLILADEPTGNLDSHHSRTVVELLSAIARERDAGVLLVTHDLEIATIADRSFVLRDGKLAEKDRNLQPHPTPVLPPQPSPIARKG